MTLGFQMYSRCNHEWWGIWGDCTRYIEAKRIWHETPIRWRHRCCCTAHWIYGWYRRSSCSFNLSNMSTCCRNSVTSLQAAVPGIPGTLLILARLVSLDSGVYSAHLGCCLEPEEERMLLEDLRHHRFRSRDNLPLLPAHLLHQFPHQIRLWWQVSHETVRHSFPPLSSKQAKNDLV